MSRLMITIILMALVTYLPRMLPMVALGDRKLPPFWDSLFFYIPFAVLGALIFPGVLNSTGDLRTSIAGVLVAVGLGLWGRGPIPVVFGAILTALAVGMVL